MLNFKQTKKIQLKNMDSLKSLEEQFKRIDSKIITKTELISRNYDRNDAKIKEQLQEADFKNGINQARDMMLKQMWNQRNEQLKQVDNLKSRVQYLSEFKRKAEAIKSANLSFARPLVRIYESILSRSKFESLFDLKQMLNYSKFIVAKRSFDVRAVKKKTSRSCIDGWFKLPSDLLLVVSSFDTTGTDKGSMSIVNEKGEIIRHKVFNEKDFMLRIQHCIKVNTTNIIVFNRISSPAIRKLMIDVYSFELELVHSFKLNDKFKHYDIKLNNYEIVLYKLYGYNGISLSCFNYKNIRFKQRAVHLDTSSFLNKSSRDRLSTFLEYSQNSKSSSLKLQHLDDEFVYLILTERKVVKSTLLIFDRVRYENLFKFVIFSINCTVVMYNSEIGLIGDSSEFKAYKIKPDKSYVETVCKTKKKFEDVIFEDVITPFNKTILTEYFYFVENGGESRIQFYEC